jgi:hypothetical protein
MAQTANCASVSGLDAYSSCAMCGEAGPDVVASSNDTSPAVEIDSAADAPAVEQGDDEVSDAPVGSGEDSFGMDLPPEASEEVDAVADVGPESDGAAVHDAGSGGKDSGVHDAAPEAGRIPDAAADAPMCNAASCDGCCTSDGLCAGGGLNATCGMGGAACQNCASYSLVCSAGACVTPVDDAGSTGPTTCMPTTCANLCVPYFIQCCKSDDTCGCSLLFPPGPCN